MSEKNPAGGEGRGKRREEGGGERKCRIMKEQMEDGGCGPWLHQMKMGTDESHGAYGQCG